MGTKYTKEEEEDYRNILRKMARGIRAHDDVTADSIIILASNADGGVSIGHNVDGSLSAQQQSDLPMITMLMATVSMMKYVKNMDVVLRTPGGEIIELADERVVKSAVSGSVH